VGYLRVVEIALLHSRRWAGTLVATAAAALIAGSASPALAQAGGARPAPTPTVEAKPLPSAGWHGQPIRRPYEARSSQPTTAQPPDGAAARLRAGYGRADGSAPVRRLQWMLLGLAAGADRRAAARPSVIVSPPAWPRADASPTQYDERHNGPGVVRSVLLALFSPLALAGLALLVRAARRRRVARGPRAAPVAAGRRLAASSRGLTAIGYARGRDAAEFKRHKAVIERACSQRGWTLASLVRDSHPAHSQRIPRQTGRTDRGPMAPQAPVALIGWTR
jgi:hypothetical protein